MKFFKNPIVKWLALAFSLFIAAIMIQGISALRQMETMNQKTTEITQNWLPSVELIGQINTDTSDFRIKQLRHNLATTQEELRQQEAEMQRELASLQEARTAYEALLTTDEEKKLYAEFATEWEEYMEIHQTFLPLSQANKNEEAATILKDSTDQFNQLSSDLNELVELNEKAAVAAGQQAQQTFDQGRTLIFTLLITTIVLSVVAAFGFSRLIFRSVAGVLWPVINQLVASITTLSSSSQQASAAAVQNAGVAQQVAAGAAQQSRQSEEVSRTITQMAAATAQMSASAQTASAASLKTSQIAQETGDKTEKIGKVVDTITAIAEQTNLLSLNASIEAARAGEQGRGFAVVADEVKKLAEQSASSADDVKTIVKEVIDSIASTVTSIQSVSTKVEEVSGAAQEQAAAIHQIAKTMDSVAAVTEQNTAGASSLSSASEQQSAAIQEVAKVSEKLQALADILSRLAGNGHGHNSMSTESPTAPTGAHTTMHHTKAFLPENNRREFEHHLEKVQEHLTHTPSPKVIDIKPAENLVPPQPDVIQEKTSNPTETPRHDS